MKSLSILTGGVAFYQLSFISALLVLQSMISVPELAQVVLFFSLVQFLGAVVPLQLPNEMIRTPEDGRAAHEFTSLLVWTGLVSGVIAVAVLASGFGVHLAWQAGLGTLVFAWSDIMRAAFVRSEQSNWQAAPHLVLGLGLLSGTLAVLLRPDPDLFIGVFAGASLVGLVLASPLRAVPSAGCMATLARKGWRFIVYRTPTTAIDVLLTRSLVLFMTPLGEAFVNAFFLAIRVLLGPVQMVIWAASFVIYKRSLAIPRERLGALVRRTWIICCGASVAVLWIGTGLAWILRAPVDRFLGLATPGLVAWICLGVLVIVASQIYIGWLGRIFDSYDRQRRIVIYEVTAKTLILGAVYLVARIGGAEDFLIVYTGAYVLFTIGFLYNFGVVMGMPIRQVAAQYLLGTVGIGAAGAMVLLMWVV